ncbi:MAG: primosomal protein N', partial [Oscillospiraceae bacterium]|nr:primosomal protein N' [Oscillospiraceae bacterium]
MERFARVAVRNVPYAADKPYTYRVPPSLTDSVRPGVRVTVPFGQGNRRQEGFVLRLTSEAGRDGLKVVETVLDTSPVLTENQLKLAVWMRERFFCTVYEAARAMLPSGLWYTWDEAAREGETPKRRMRDKTSLFAELAVSAEETAAAGKSTPAQKEVLELLRDVGSASVREICYLTGTSRRTLNVLEAKGLITLYEEPVYRTPSVPPRAEPITLNGEQEAAFLRCKEALDARKPVCGLLYGVTGSGKTNVYIRLTKQVLSEGGGAIVLVPEIALTPQLMTLFASHFGVNAALLHSGLSMGERLNEWKRVREGLATVVLGTRSAVFAPVRNLRLIVLDEEQEGTYKSENAPRYHAREAAKYRCVKENATLLLGSATPSVETFTAAVQGAVFLCRLKERYNKKALPEVKIVSLREERKCGNDTTISQLLHNEITENLARGEQTVLLLNRRGHHRSMICPDCGANPGCPRCSVPLTFHSANNRLMCHYCGYSQKHTGICSECGAQLIPLGAGTQRVVEELEKLFPGAETLRMDADTTGSRGAHEQILDTFRRKKVPFLVGTQMVAKGLDFPDVTLAGVLCADAALCMDDFRAGERAFSLMTQVIGRAGRG